MTKQARLCAPAKEARAGLSEERPHHLMMALSAARRSGAVVQAFEHEALVVLVGRSRSIEGRSRWYDAMHESSSRRHLAR